MRSLVVSLVINAYILLVGLGLSPGFGAQPLTDAELDAITAAGSFSIEIIPPSAPAPPTAPAAPIAFQSASAAIQAASAALEAASTLNNQQGVPVATKAVQAASAALDTISNQNGLKAVNAASEAIEAASSALGALSLDPVAKTSPSILAASEALQSANNNLVQNSLQNGSASIGAASAALKAVSAALEGVPGHNGNGMDGAAAAPAILAASDAVKAASAAVNLASNLAANGPTPGSSQGGIAINPFSGGKAGGELGNLPDPALLTETPAVKFKFDAGGGTLGSGSAQIPVTGPSLNANNPNMTFSGNPILSGNAFQVQNMLLNMNICVQCRASGHIVQTGNGFVFPITIQ